MWMITMLACAPEPPPPPVAPVRPVVVAETAPLTAIPNPPATPEREPLTEATAVRSWGTRPPACGGPCTPLAGRLQASSEAKTDSRVAAASLAGDGDLTTAWCAEGRVGQKLSFGMSGRHTVRRVLVAGWTGRGASITGLDLVTDRGDRIPATFTAPTGTWPAAATVPPSVDALLDDVQFVQLEVTAVEGDGPACIAEMLVLGQ